MINGKELMIGDYVDVNDNDDVVVLGVVKEICDEGEQLTVSINDDKVFDVCADEDISPIILSKEFFLKNGFAELYADNHIARLYNRDKGLIVIFYPPDNCFRCGTDKIVINYVHEFQRYLRLVNLPGYANRLKI